MQDILPNDALLMVDVQIDFFPGGALPVPNGDQIIPAVNQMIKAAKENNIPIFADRDWHPKDNISFIEQGGPFAPHCVQNTKGAEFHPDIPFPSDHYLVSKGYESDSHPYSPFEGILDDGTPLLDALKKLGIERLWIGGLCLDYCVAAAAFDSVKYGFKTILVNDATLPLDTSREQEVLTKLKNAGVEIIE